MGLARRRGPAITPPVIDVSRRGTDIPDGLVAEW